MKKLLVALTFNLILISSKLVAQTPYVAIPDSNFVHYLKTIVPTAFKGDSLNTSSTLVTTTTHSIDCSGKSISNLSGVQYFTSLIYLNCGYDTITNLLVIPSSLTYLDCSYDSLISLPTLPNSLTYLNCSNNSLTSLPTLPNSLTYLNCYNNSLTTLPSLPNTLQSLFCAYNQLTSLPTLPNSLDSIDCSANHLATLPALPNSLAYLNCWNNQLMSLPTLPNTLTYLDCSYNQLTSLPPLPNSLVHLYCMANNITCFTTFPTSITNLTLDPGNPYNCLPNHIAAMNAADLAKPLCAAGNTNGCAVAGIEQVTGINSPISVYPNPASDIINVNGLPINEETHIQLIDMFGNFVREYTTSAEEKDIDVSSLQEGVYNLCITTKEGTVNKKLVIVN